jgi:hypothetical protein
LTPAAEAIAEEEVIAKQRTHRNILHSLSSSEELMTHQPPLKNHPPSFPPQSPDATSTTLDVSDSNMEEDFRAVLVHRPIAQDNQHQDDDDGGKQQRSLHGIPQQASPGGGGGGGGVCVEEAPRTRKPLSVFPHEELESSERPTRHRTVPLTLLEEEEDDDEGEAPHHRKQEILVDHAAELRVKREAMLRKVEDALHKLQITAQEPQIIIAEGTSEGSQERSRSSVPGDHNSREDEEVDDDYSGILDSFDSTVEDDHTFGDTSTIFTTMTHLRHQAQQSPILLENIPHIPNVEAVAIVQKDDLEAMEKKELIAMIDTLLNCKTNHNSHHRNKNKAVVVVPVPPKKSPLERSNHTPIPQQQKQPCTPTKNKQDWRNQVFCPWQQQPSPQQLVSTMKEITTTAREEIASIRLEVQDDKEGPQQQPAIQTFEPILPPWAQKNNNHKKQSPSVPQKQPPPSQKEVLKGIVKEASNQHSFSVPPENDNKVEDKIQPSPLHDSKISEKSERAEIQYSPRHGSTKNPEKPAMVPTKENSLQNIQEISNHARPRQSQEPKASSLSNLGISQSEFSHSTAASTTTTGDHEYLLATMKQPRTKRASFTFPKNKSASSASQLVPISENEQQADPTTTMVNGPESLLSHQRSKSWKKRFSFKSLSQRKLQQQSSPGTKKKKKKKKNNQKLSPEMNKALLFTPGTAEGIFLRRNVEDEDEFSESSTTRRRLEEINAMWNESYTKDDDYDDDMSSSTHSSAATPRSHQERVLKQDSGKRRRRRRRHSASSC